MATVVRRVVGGSEVLGGTLLMANVLWQIRRGATAPDWLIVLAVLAGAASTAGGVLLWRERCLGRQISLIVQALQILRVQTSRFGYVFVAGVQLNVTVPLRLQFGFFGTLSLRWHAASPFMVGVNLFSLAATMALLGRGLSASDIEPGCGRLRPGAPAGTPASRD